MIHNEHTSFVILNLHLLCGNPSIFIRTNIYFTKVLSRNRFDEPLTSQSTRKSGGVALSKIYVLDTNVLLQDPYSIFSFEDNEVVIPAVVLEEVDSKKRYMDEIGRNARHVSRLIDGLRAAGK